MPAGSLVKLYHSSVRTQVAGNPLRSGMIRVRDVDRRLLDRGVVVEQRAAPHVGHPVPVAVRVGGGVDADEALAALDTSARTRVRWAALRMPSPSVCSITTTSYGRRPASVNVVASSVSVTLKFFSAPERLDAGLAGVDRVGMAEARRLREDEHVVARRLRRRRCGGGSQQCGGQGHRLPSQSHSLSPSTPRRPAARRRGSAAAPRGRPAAPRRSSRSRSSPVTITSWRSASEVATPRFCSTTSSPMPPAARSLIVCDQPLDDGRREALGRLVHDQQLRVGQQRAADREHLLLAARTATCR